MKNKTAAIILIIAIITTAFLSILTQAKISENKNLKSEIGEMSNVINSLESEINNLDSEIEEMSNKEFTRVSVVNDYWQYTTAGNTLYGHITFDDISLIKDLEITFKDSVFCPVLVETATIAINAEENKIVTSCIYNEENPSFAVITVFYLDGRSEDITIKICMG